MFYASKTLELICSWLIGLIKAIIEPTIVVNIKKVVIFIILVLNAPVWWPRGAIVKFKNKN